MRLSKRQGRLCWLPFSVPMAIELGKTGLYRFQQPCCICQSWEVPDWDARPARAQSMTLGVVAMVTSIKNGVPYVRFTCHT